MARSTTTRPASPRNGARVSNVDLFRLFLTHRRDPEPLMRLMAVRAVDDLEFPVAGRRIVDLGCGPGYTSEALEAAGATVVAFDLDADDVVSAAERTSAPAVADARRLPLASASVDGVYCSNLLEHTPEPAAVLDEIARVLVPGGWAWISWTNWYSPWGGHAITPLHYLGPRRGLAAWRKLRGEPRRNVPFVELWPTHIGQVLREVDARPMFRLLDARPRYYPSQRWILRVPGAREVLTWNCVLSLERVAG